MVIAISGKMRSGKSTFARYLREALIQKYGVEFKIASFAEPLKKEVVNVLGLDSVDQLNELKNTPLVEVNESLAKKINQRDVNTIRQFLQYYGETLRSSFYSGYWIDRFHNEYKDTNIIIDDLRYQNEFNYVTSQFDSFTIRIARNIEKRFPEYKDLLNYEEEITRRIFDTSIPKNTHNLSTFINIMAKFDLGDALTHISEIDLDHRNDFDCFVNNNDNSESLNLKAKEFVNQFNYDTLR